MAGSFPITHDQLVNHLAEQGLITNLTIQEHLEETEYVKGATMRQWVAAELRQEHDALERRLVESVRDLFNRTSAMADSFDARVEAATAQLSPRQDSVTSDIKSRDDQLRQHIDAASIARDEQFALLTTQLAEAITLSEAKITSSLDASVARLNDIAFQSTAE